MKKCEDCHKHDICETCYLNDKIEELRGEQLDNLEEQLDILEVNGGLND